MRRGSMTPEEIKRRMTESLRNNNLKLARQRREIIEVLSSDRSHPNARDIWRKVRLKVPSVSLSTLYHSLHLFKKDGSLKEWEFCDVGDRYESNVTDHLDLVCLGCGKIVDFVGEVPIPVERVERKTGCKVDRIRFAYYGYCRNCRRQGAVRDLHR
jgi:Fe2+ or Zn2+ uptake regulation protein